LPAGYFDKLTSKSAKVKETPGQKGKGEVYFNFKGTKEDEKKMDKHLAMNLRVNFKKDPPS
jgi:hypothetical protein